MLLGLAAYCKCVCIYMHYAVLGQIALLVKLSLIDWMSEYAGDCKGCRILVQELEPWTHHSWARLSQTGIIPQGFGGGGDLEVPMLC